LVDQNVNML